MLLEIIGNHEPANRSSVQKGSMAPFPVCIRVHLSMKKNGVWIQNWTSAHNRGGPLCYGVPVPALVILPHVGIPESPQNQEEICKRFWNSSAKWPEKTDPSSTPAFPGRLWSLYTFWMDTSDGSMVLLSVVKVPLGWWCSHGLGVPSIGVPPVIIHFCLGFSLLNHPAFGYSHDYGNAHLTIGQLFVFQFFSAELLEPNYILLGTPALEDVVGQKLTLW